MHGSCGRARRHGGPTPCSRHVPRRHRQRPPCKSQPTTRGGNNPTLACGAGCFSQAVHLPSQVGRAGGGSETILGTFWTSEEAARAEITLVWILLHLSSEKLFFRVPGPLKRAENRPKVARGGLSGPLWSSREWLRASSREWHREKCLRSVGTQRKPAGPGSR